MSTRPIAVGPDRWEPSSTRAPGELKAGAGPSTALRAGGRSGGIGKSPPHAAGPSTTLRAGRPPPRGHRPFDYAQGRRPRAELHDPPLQFLERFVEAALLIKLPLATCERFQWIGGNLIGRTKSRSMRLSQKIGSGKNRVRPRLDRCHNRKSIQSVSQDCRLEACPFSSTRSTPSLPG